MVFGAFQPRNLLDGDVGQRGHRGVILGLIRRVVDQGSAEHPPEQEEGEEEEGWLSEKIPQCQAPKCTHLSKVWTPMMPYIFTGG